MTQVVNDTSFMQKGLDGAEPEQKAQVALLTGKTVDGKRLSGWTVDWAEPYHWDPFILAGDFR